MESEPGRSEPKPYLYLMTPLSGNIGCVAQPSPDTDALLELIHAHATLITDLTNARAIYPPGDIRGITLDERILNARRIAWALAIQLDRWPHWLGDQP